MRSHRLAVRAFHAQKSVQRRRPIPGRRDAGLPFNGFDIFEHFLRRGVFFPRWNHHLLVGRALAGAGSLLRRVLRSENYGAAIVRAQVQTIGLTSNIEPAQVSV